MRIEIYLAYLSMYLFSRLKNEERDAEHFIARITDLVVGKGRIGIEEVELGEVIKDINQLTQTVSIDTFEIENDPGEKHLQLLIKVKRFKDLIKKESSLSKEELFRRLLQTLDE